MKRITAGIIILAMMITLPLSISAASGKVFIDVNGNEYYAESAEALNSQGIIEGYEDGSFGAYRCVTRAEMAAVICRMLGRDSEANQMKGATVFEDVASGGWASGYINLAQQEGIIMGDGNGKFRPSDNVKLEEAVKMVVCALKFDDNMTTAEDDWSYGYMQAAREKGLLDNLIGKKGENAVRGDIAVMVFQGLKVKLLETDLSSEYPRLIAHACGTVDGITMTNSLEALESSIEKGFKWIEIDFAMTDDGKIAALHDWAWYKAYSLGVSSTASVDYETFRSSRVLGKYTPVTMEVLEKVLSENPDVRIITDTKDDNLTILTEMKKEAPEIMDQIIPQIYDYTEYDAVKNLGFDDVILTLYKMNSKAVNEDVVYFVVNKRVYAVTMDYALVNNGIASKLKDVGVKVYMHTINSSADMMNALNGGAYGIYTDTLVPRE